MTCYTFQQSLHTQNYGEKTALEAESSYKIEISPLKMTCYTFQQSLHTRNYSEKTALEAESNYKNEKLTLKWLAKLISSHFKLKIDGEKTLKWESSHNFGHNFSEMTLKWESSRNYTPLKLIISAK